LLARRGLLGHLCRGTFRLIRRSWHMYPVGILFGLGFDTASEIMLIGITVSGSPTGLSPWSVLIYPALFTAGMALFDTIDSVLMTGVYGWAVREPLTKLYYNLTVTGISVIVALAIGIVGALELLRDRAHLSSGIERAVGWLSNEFRMAGYMIMSLFALCWFGFFLFLRLRRSARILLRT
jgi:nickel/cobalt transporter (NiCoT) family protein